MDPFFTPSRLLILLKAFAHLLSDLDKLKYYDFERIKSQRNKIFQQQIKYASKVPLYQEKFKQIGITPEDIKGIEDIEKLPIINRKDIIAYYPKGIIAPGYEKDSILVNTSGSTRNPVSIYVDQFTLLKALIGYVRELRQYGIKWNKSRISIIANFYSQTAPTQYIDSGASPALKPVKFAFPLNNLQQINADDDLDSILKRIDEFKPDCIMGFPGPLRHLALLREKGHGENIHPRCIISSGGIIDTHEKRHIGEVFNTRVFDAYGSTEAGPISFECEEGNFHINSDFIYVEAIDSKGNTKEKGKDGILAVTRIYGRGTPLIRYTGMDDMIALKDGTCSCGRDTELIKSVHGRIKECIVLPNGKIIYPRTLMEIQGEVMSKLKTNKIYVIQLVQESLDQIEVLVIIDEEKRDEEPSTEKILNELKAEYEQIFGSEIGINVKEVAKLRSEDENAESTPGVLSKIDVRKYI